MGRKTSTTVVSLMNIEARVLVPRTASWSSHSRSAQARKIRTPNTSAAPVRTRAAPTTNIEVTMITAALPKPENPSW